MTELPAIADRAEADRAYYRRIAAEYFARHEQPIQRYATRVEQAWLAELVPPASRVLLVGVGGGRELETLLRRDCRITGLDYSQEMLDAGREHWADDRIEWVLGDAHELSGQAGRHDAVVSLAAVNYFVEAPLAMEQMGAALVPGGRLIVSSINRLHPSEANAPSRPARPGAVTRILYAPEELAELAERAGLTVESIRGLRHWVDSLPPAWNRPGAAASRRAALAAALAAEPLARRILPARRAKFFWLVARR